MKRLVFCLTVVGLCCALQACSFGSFSRYNADGYDYDNYYVDEEGNRRPSYYRSRGGGHYRRQRVSVPHSYHFSGGNSPRTHKNRDANWAQSQNPNAYTIQLSSGEKASTVAKDIATTPKFERAAQIKYEQNGRKYYRGVYGTYSSREEAEKAMQRLPSNVRQKAAIKNWSRIQDGMKKPAHRPVAAPSMDGDS